jgi:hypothetical protein
MMKVSRGPERHILMATVSDTKTSNTARELVTKEAIPRHIIVEDPGETSS